jgi:Transposase, Mutator family
MYLAGVSVRRVEDITEALWGTRVSPSTVSELNKKIYGTIEAWRNRPIDGEHPYVYLDGIVLKRCWAGEVRNVSLLVAIGVNSEGYREILGICEGAKEDKAGLACCLSCANPATRCLTPRTRRLAVSFEAISIELARVYDVEDAHVFLTDKAIAVGDFMGETWARANTEAAKSLMIMVGAVGIEPTTSPV